MENNKRPENMERITTPELAEARFWGGLTQWGTVLMLAGVILTMLKSAKKGKNP